MNLKFPPAIFKKNKYSIPFYPFKYLSILSFLLILVFFTGSFAQVKIKEKVEITPEVNSLKVEGMNKTNLSTHTITFVATWEETHREAAVRNVSSCSENDGGSGWMNGGTITHVINNAVAGSHSFQFAVNSNSQLDESGDLTWEIYLDGALESNGVYENAYWGGAGFRIGPTFNTPYKSGVDFSISEESFCPEGNRWVSASLGKNDCASDGNWMPLTESVTFTITQGGEHTSFLGSLSQLITISPGEFEEGITGAELVTNYEVLNGNTGNLTVSVQAGTIEEESTIIIDPNSGFESLDIDVWLEEEEIFQGDEIEIDLYTYINRFCFLPSSVKYEVSIIAGENLGSLFDPQSGQKGKSLNNLEHTEGGYTFLFIADGDRPTGEYGEVTLNISTNNAAIPSVQENIRILKDGIIVEFSKDYLTPGEEADIILSTENELGEKISFPTDQSFTIGIFENDNYANILKGDDTTKYKFLENTKQPFRILAEEEIDLGSVNVRIYVDNGSVTDGGGGSGEVLANVQQKSSNISKVQAESDSISVDQIIRKRVSKLRKKVSGTTKLAKVSSVSSIDEGPEILVGYGNIDIIKGKPKLKIIRPFVLEEPFIYWITPIPTMPIIQLRAERSGILNLTSVVATWTCSLSYNYQIADGRSMPNGETTLTGTQTYTGETTFDENDRTEWNLDFNNSDPIIGGKARIMITATVDGVHYSDELVVYIRAKNPDDADVTANTDAGQLAMLTTEERNYDQFDTESYATPNQGLPLRGGDLHGWGSCQIDNRSHIITTGILWDWRENKRYGLWYYDNQRNRAERHLEDGDLNNPYTGHTRQSMIDYEGYSKYNGGPSAQVWEWRAQTRTEPARWVRNVTRLYEVYESGVSTGRWERRHNQDIDTHVTSFGGNYNN